jgi:hypothetical protein
MTLRRRQTRSVSRHKKRLTSEEFASLKQLADNPRRVTVPEAHRDRLIAAGYVREVLPAFRGISALALTGAGLRRLEAGE